MDATAGTLVEQAQPTPEATHAMPAATGRLTTWETIELESNRLVGRVEELIHEGTVRRIVVK